MVAKDKIHNGDIEMDRLEHYRQWCFKTMGINLKIRKYLTNTQY